MVCTLAAAAVQGGGDVGHASRLESFDGVEWRGMLFGTRTLYLVSRAKGLSAFSSNRHDIVLSDGGLSGKTSPP